MNITLKRRFKSQKHEQLNKRNQPIDSNINRSTTSITQPQNQYCFKKINDWFTQKLKPTETIQQYTFTSTTGHDNRSQSIDQIKSRQFSKKNSLQKTKIKVYACQTQTKTTSKQHTSPNDAIIPANEQNSALKNTNKIKYGENMQTNRCTQVYPSLNNSNHSTFTKNQSFNLKTFRHSPHDHTINDPEAQIKYHSNKDNFKKIQLIDELSQTPPRYLKNKLEPKFPFSSLNLSPIEVRTSEKNIMNSNIFSDKSRQLQFRKSFKQSQKSQLSLKLQNSLYQPVFKLNQPSNLSSNSIKFARSIKVSNEKQFQSSYMGSQQSFIISKGLNQIFTHKTPNNSTQQVLFQQDSETNSVIQHSQCQSSHYWQHLHLKQQIECNSEHINKES